MRIVAKTDKGHVRDSNQDAYAVGEFSDEVVWAVVCDGMGGAAGGNIASALAVKVISDKINVSYREQMRDSSIKNMLDSALNAANVEVFDMSESKHELKGMGTTVVCAIVKDGQAYIAHAGDSRAYILKNGKIFQITTDHSIVQDLLDKGKITSEQALNHPNKNIITRAVGVDTKKLKNVLNVPDLKRKKNIPVIEEEKTENAPEELPNDKEEVPVSNIDTEPEVLNPADVAEFKSRMIEHFRRKDTLQQSLLELQELYENGPILERIEKALMYSQRSRYRDFETTLDILFEGMDAETLRDDLLRMEVLRYRRLPYRQENTTGNLV